jgi:replicative DNA helicase
MEEPGTHSGFQHEKELENFLQFGTAAPSNAECLTPISSLPSHYRNEIEKGYSTGWKCLDRYLQGLRKGEVTVITADTGAGKTTFCTQLMVNCAMQNIPVWINSWEMKPETTMRKLASIVLRRPMKLQSFSDHENEQFDEWGSRYHVFINPNTIGTDINSLSTQLVQAKKLGVEIVMLDHLDYLVNMRKEKLHEAIDETVKRLHELAFTLSMHFLLICHPRQSSTGTEEVGIHSLKGSSSIKQYADNVLVLHRCARTDSSSDPNKVKIKIAKNRMFGFEGTTYLWYEPLWDGYTELKDTK